MPNTTVWICGFEAGAGDEMIVNGAGGHGGSIVTTPVRTGIYALQFTTTTAGTLVFVDLPLSDMNQCAAGFWFRKAANPASANTIFKFDVVSTPMFTLQLRTDGTLGITTSGGFSATNGATALSNNTWHCIRVVYDQAAGGVGKVWLDDSLEIDTTHTGTNGATTRFQLQGNAGNTTLYDDMILQSGTDQPPKGVGGVIARSFMAGTPTDNGFTKTGGTNIEDVCADTPRNAATLAQNISTSGQVAQTGLVHPFSTTQTGHGSNTLGAYDTINAIALGMWWNDTQYQASPNPSDPSIRYRINGGAAVDFAFPHGNRFVFRYYQRILTTLTTANLDVLEVGANHASAAIASVLSIQDVWVMVHSEPGSAPAVNTALEFSRIKSVTVAGLPSTATRGFQAITPIGAGRILALAAYEEADTPAADVWRSDDSGASWIQLTDLPESGGYGFSRAISPGLDTALVYQNGVDPSGTYLLGTIWRTTDGGATWTKPFTGGPDKTTGPMVEGADFGFGVLIFVGGPGASAAPPPSSTARRAGLRDRGFYQQQRGRFSPHPSLGWSQSSTTGTAGSHGLRSADGGATWASLGLINPNAYYGRCSGIVSAGGGKGFAALDRPDLTSATGIFIHRTVNYGSSWSPVSTALPIFGYNSLANTTFLHGIGYGDGVLMVCGSYGLTHPMTPYLWRSTDEGTTWTTINLTSLLALIDGSGNPVPIVEIRYMGSAKWIARTGFTDKVIQVAGNVAVPENTWLYSEDGGATWRRCDIRAGDDPSTLNEHPPTARGLFYQTMVTIDGIVFTAGQSNSLGAATNEIWSSAVLDPAPADPPPEGLPTQGTARRYSSRDVDAGGVFYARGLLTDPVVTKSLVDLQWGQVVIEGARFELLLDAVLLQGYIQDLRGQQFTLTRYDTASGFAQSTLLGVVTKPTLAAGRLIIEGENFDPGIFEQDLPKGTIMTDEFPNAVDLGLPITKVLGRVAQVPLRYINDDIVNSEFDYLVSRNIVGVSFIFRLFNGALTDVDPSEYTVSYTNYPGYTTVRFRLRQTQTVSGNDFYPIFADVLGRESERNVAIAIKNMLSNTIWGLGRTVDTASFDAAAAILDPSVTGLRVDGALTTVDQAQNWLKELFMFAGIRMHITAAGAIAIDVETAQTTPRLAAHDGTGDGSRILIDPTRFREPMGDAPRRAIMKYREDLRNPGQFFFEQSRDVNTDMGKDRIFPNRFIRTHRTADKVIDRIAHRMADAQERATATLAQEARGLRPGELITLTYPLLGLNARVYEVTRLSVASDVTTVDLVGWSAYTYTPGTLPGESTGGGGPVGAPPPSEEPPPDGTPPQPEGFPPYDWGSFGMQTWRTYLDFRGLNDLFFPPATTISANTPIAIALPINVTRGSIKIFDNPITVTHPVTGLRYAVAQASSQRITDNGAGGLVGAIGTGALNSIDYATGIGEVSFAATATTPIEILFELDGMATAIL